MSNRSGTHYSAPTDADRRPVVMGVSTNDGETPVPLEVDPLTGELQVNANVSATITGQTIPASSLSEALAVQIVDGSGDQITSFGGGTQYTTGSAEATPTGTLSLGWDGTNVKALPLDNSGYLKVNVAAGGASGGTSSSFSSAFPSTGTAIGASDGTNMEPLLVDGSGNLKVAQQGSVAVTGTFFQSTQPVSLATNTPTLQSGSTTAVTQTTAANLNATVVGTGTFATQSTLAAETTKVIGVTRTADGSGNLLTSTANALDINIKSGNLTTLPVTNAGTFAVQSTLQSGSALVGKVGIDQTTPGTTNAVSATNLPSTVDTNVGAVSSSTPRIVVANGAGRTLKSAGGSASSSGNNTLVVAGTNKLKVYAFSLSTTSTTAVTCIFQDGASGTALWEVVLQAPTSVSTGANLVVQPPAWLFAGSTATLLNLNLSGAQTVIWSVSYFDEE